MVIMALDHVRDYFHYSAFFFDPSDPVQTTWPIYLTRFVTHFCAPAFSFLAGLSAFMVGKRKSKNELSAFLLKRGFWLVFIEITIVTFGWHFDIQFRNILLQTIWSLGISMIILAGLIHLPKTIILIFSCIIIFGHNLLDPIHFGGNVFWSFFTNVAAFHTPMIITFVNPTLLFPGSLSCHWAIASGRYITIHLRLVREKRY